MPYTTEQLQSVSTLFAAERIGAAEAVSMLKEMERRSVVRVCEYSGEIIEDDPLVVEVRRSRPVPHGRNEYRAWQFGLEHWVERHYFADEDNARAFGCRQCDCCGEWTMPDHDEGVYVHEYWFCSYDCAHDSGWEECESCGCWVHEDDLVYIEDGHCFCDDYCAERAGWYRCGNCGEWTHESDSWCVRSGGVDQSWCEYCRDNNATCCEGCGDTVNDDEVAYDDQSGCYYCDDCRNDCCCGAHIESWSYTPSEIRFFSVPDAEPAPFLGVELETDGGHGREMYAAKLEGLERFKELWWMTDDGSLDDSGVELTSHPMTLAYHESVMGLYEEIGAVAKEFGYKSHDTGRCGLHVSVDKKWFGKSPVVQDAGIYKLMRLTQRFERQLTAFSRRTDNHWCKYCTNEDYSPSKAPLKVDVRNVRGVGEGNLFAKSAMFKANEGGDKYRAVNIRHRNHVEIRIFRGTLKWSTYFASLALVDGLARVVKEHGSIWIESVSWYELVDCVIAAVRRGGNGRSAECLENYLDEKGLLR